MATKTNALSFTVQATPDNRDDRQPRYHVRQLKKGVMTGKALARRLVESSSITYGDYEGFIAALIDEIPEALALGQDLRIEGLGTFYLKVSLAKKRGKDGRLHRPVFEKPEDITARDVVITGIGFKADKSFNQRTRRLFSTFQKVDANHSEPITRSSWLKGLYELTKEQGYFTERDVRYKFGLTKYMSEKMLTELVNEEYPKYHREKLGTTYIYKKTGDNI